MATKATVEEFVPKALGYDAEEIGTIGTLMGFPDATIEEHQSRLKAMVPPEWKAERYIHRLWAGRHDFDRFDLARQTRHNILMPGPTGAGKTTAAIAYAALNRMPYTSVEFDGGFVFADVIGATKWGLDGKPYFMFGDLSLIVLYGGLADLSDCNLAPPKFMSPTFPMLDQRQILPIKEAGVVLKKHPNCLVCGSYNPDYKGTSQLNEAFINRFGLPVKWGYDDGVEEALIGSRSPTLLTQVRRLRAHEDIRTDIGTNVMEEFITFAQHPMGDLAIAIEAMTYRFPDDEQEIVYRAMEANQYAIATELGVDVDVVVEEITADEEPAF